MPPKIKSQQAMASLTKESLIEKTRELLDQAATEDGFFDKDRKRVKGEKLIDHIIDAHVIDNVDDPLGEHITGVNIENGKWSLEGQDLEENFRDLFIDFNQRISAFSKDSLFYHATAAFDPVFGKYYYNVTFKVDSIPEDIYDHQLSRLLAPEKRKLSGITITTYDLGGGNLTMDSMFPNFGTLEQKKSEMSFLVSSGTLPSSSSSAPPSSSRTLPPPPSRFG